ncbi:glycosyltransferase [Candidatus Manganitrophus noduliformans]|uniref:Glycosyltransferase n=1 Tax=Candidatus Manganitrophus noduliformans TaxID=2606439 RepID=A0A7X6DRQ4_9BACT|nr:glycosyltransferase [Candidatus Manganitrophus noduliformans]NKE72120.1 glycosyltransferase [Candidatus Manganitrophus noduliformans]
MHKIKIAYLIDTIICDTAGTEKQLLQIIQRLDRNIFEPSLVCLWKSSWMEMNPLPCEVITLGYRGFIKPNIINVLGRWVDLLRERKFDIVHTFFEDAIFVGYLGALLSRSVPVLLSSRRDMGLGEQPWYHSAYRQVLPFVNRRFDGIVANSHNLKRYVIERERLSEEKVTVIHNGVSIPLVVAPKPPIFCENRADLWIGIAANLKPVKRIDLFLQAVAKVKAAFPEGFRVRAVVLGAGPKRDALYTLSGFLGLSGDVHFLGAVPDVTPYLQHLDIGVLCSDREGFSNALLEYMSCALPVVATNVGGNAELVDSSNGFCVPPGDPEALAEALIKLALDPVLRKEMGRRSLEKVERTYFWEKTMRELEDYYCGLLKRFPAQMYEHVF